MARKNKTYQHGDRLQVYLSNNLEQEFIDWINQQSDKSNFFLYAAAKLYEEHGPVDISPEIPRRLVLKNNPGPKDELTATVDSRKKEIRSESTLKETQAEDKQEAKDEPKKAWAGTDLGDDDTFG